MKQLIPIALFSIAFASCNNVKKSESDSDYSIQCSPKIQNVEGAIKLIPSIEWEQKIPGSLTYSAIIFYRKNGSTDLTRGFELQGSGAKGTDSSSATVQADSIEELLVLFTVFNKDKNVVSREWYTSKSNG